MFYKLCQSEEKILKPAFVFLIYQLTLPIVVYSSFSLPMKIIIYDYEYLVSISITHYFSKCSKTIFSSSSKGLHVVTPESPHHPGLSSDRVKRAPGLRMNLRGTSKHWWRTSDPCQKKNREKRPHRIFIRAWAECQHPLRKSQLTALT